MPLDYSIALGQKPAEFPDPLEGYGKFQQIRGYQAQADQSRSELAENSALKAYFGEKRNLRDPAVQNELLRLGGKKGMELAKASFETGKASQEALAKKFETMGTVLSRNVRNPEQAKNYTIAIFNDPELAPLLASSGQTLESSLDALDKDVAEGNFDQWVARGVEGTAAMKQHFVSQDFGGGTRVLGMSPYGGAAREVPGSRVATTLSPNRSQTTVNVNTAAKPFAQTLGKKRAEKFDMLASAAEEAPGQMETADRILATLAEGNAITGILAPTRLELAKGLHAAGIIDSDTIAATEGLWSDMGRVTLSQVKSSGLGSGQGFTDKDLNFLKRVTAGDETMNARTLKRLAELNRRAAVRSVEKYNKQVQLVPQETVEGSALPKQMEVPKSAPANAYQEGDVVSKGGVTKKLKNGKWVDVR